MTTLILSVFFSISASAYDVEVDGIYYNLVKKAKQAEVTNGDNLYSGDIVIPSSIIVDEVEYKVTSIITYAFKAASITSISIPNTITTIGSGAFESCKELISVEIPNSIQLIESYLFDGCENLTTVIIPNSITEIRSCAFFNCKSITTIELPNSVTKIGMRAFEECSNLSNISLPNSIINIEIKAFLGCKNLKSIIIPTSLAHIKSSLFLGCTNLKSIEIPDNIYSIGESAFAGCTSLEKVVLGTSVNTIYDNAFSKCTNLSDFYCMSESIPYAYPNTFKDSYIGYATLYAPQSIIGSYQASEPWSGFGTFKTLEGSEVETQKCATPTISYSDGQLQFTCDTEGAKCYYTLNNSDVKTGETLAESNNVNLSACYDITCYAKAEGFVNSDVATAKLYWLPSSGSLEGAGINNVSMRGIAIQSAGGFINISGLDNNETVSFYGIDGKALGSATAINGTTSFAAQSGSIVVAKIGKESIKIAVK